METTITCGVKLIPDDEGIISPSKKRIKVLQKNHSFLYNQGETDAITKFKRKAME